MSAVRMAILTTDKSGRPVPAPHWPQRSTFQELILLGRTVGVEVMVTSPRDFDWERNRVYGYTLKEGSDRPRWVRRRYPLPDVLYNRVPSRTAEGSAGVQTCLARMSRRIGPALFNPFYLSKDSVFRLLAKDPAVAPYLPPTRTLRTWTDVEDMVRRYGRVYLKPARGSLGNHTAEITAGVLGRRSGRPRYRCRYNAGGKRTRVTYARDLESVRRILAPIISHRRYVVQKAIDLAQLHGRPFDLRALVQKNEDGVWVFTGAAARVAGPGQITTHVPRGGSRASLEEALTAFPPDVANAIQDRLASLTVAIARAVEAGSRRNFAELSMDVGVDQTGHLWLFEVNSKPLRFDEVPIRRRAQERLLTYARSIARSSRPGNGYGVGHGSKMGEAERVQWPLVAVGSHHHDTFPRGDNLADDGDRRAGTG